jgi:hypothetical protein
MSRILMHCAMALMLSAASATAVADGRLDGYEARLYLSAALGSTRTADDLRFGLRLEHDPRTLRRFGFRPDGSPVVTPHDERRVRVALPAALDLSFGGAGFQALRINGVDALYRVPVNQAQESDSGSRSNWGLNTALALLGAGAAVALIVSQSGGDGSVMVNAPQGSGENEEDCHLTVVPPSIGDGCT